MTHHIAQINIGRILAPLDTPVMVDFVNNLDRINALADTASGFVWRLVGEGNDATSLRPYEDEWIIINMSVWENIGTLREYVYHTQHVEFLRRRAEWFEKLGTPIMTLWWIPKGHIPTPHEGAAKLDYLQAHGPTPLAFTFKKTFTIDEMLKYSQTHEG
jgi:hypothetical protein